MVAGEDTRSGGVGKLDAMAGVLIRGAWTRRLGSDAALAMAMDS